MKTLGSFLVSIAVLYPLLYILRTQWRQRRFVREWQNRERCRRMEVERDRYICRELERLPLSEVSDD